MTRVLIAVFTLLLAACGGDSDSGDNNQPLPDPVDTFTPETSNLSTIALVDAGGKPLANASVEVSPQAAATSTAPAALLLDNTQLITTDANGNLVLPDLQPGKYTLSVTIAGVTVNTILEILPQNAAGSATVAAPLMVSENGSGELTAESLEGKGIFASVSGIIFGPEGVLADAQIELSGGQATNGAVASAITDENGEFTLIINVSLAKLAAMSQATIRIVRDGYDTQTIVFNVSQLSNATQVTALTGLNYAMQPQDSAVAVIYQENFEQLGSDGVCGLWQAQAYAGEAGGPDFEQPMALAIEAVVDETPVVEIPQEALNLWHSHGRDLAIRNQAFLQELVLLAPDDVSEGFIPEPKDNHACWYGQVEGGNVGQGNFLGDVSSDNGGDLLDGGTSDVKNAGAIVSPLIDLSNETAPLALSFKTWWEIEAVNPNEDGFDLMTVSVSTDDGESWENIARLNPLSDPVGLNGDSRAPLPYSNRGFNKAPDWLAQEPISLSEFAGQQIRLRFAFSTQDELYNGFRGWLLDDVSVYQGEGSFPRYREPVAVDTLIANADGSLDVEQSTLTFSGNAISQEDITVKLVSYDDVGSERVLATSVFEFEDVINISLNVDLENVEFMTFVAQIFVGDDWVSSMPLAVYPPDFEEPPFEEPPMEEVPELMPM